MGKRKMRPLLPWLSGKADGREKRFIQLGNSLLLSEKFQSLSAGARMLYCCMALESGGKRGFIFPLSCAKKYGFCSSSLRRYITEMETSGFLYRNSLKNLRIPNEYAFSFEWKSMDGNI